MASSHRARPLPIWSAGGSRDRASGRGITGDLGPCRPGPTPAEPPHGSATVKIAQGKGIPEGNRRGTGTGQRPKDQTGERRTKGNQRKAEEGKEPGGQTGKPGGKPAEGNRRTCGEAPDHPVRVRGSGAARIYDAAGRSAPTAHSCPPAFWRATAVCQSRARRCTPGSVGLRPVRSGVALGGAGRRRQRVPGPGGRLDADPGRGTGHAAGRWPGPTAGSPAGRAPGLTRRSCAGVPRRRSAAAWRGSRVRWSTLRGQPVPWALGHRVGR